MSLCSVTPVTGSPLVDMYCSDPAGPHVTFTVPLAPSSTTSAVTPAGGCGGTCWFSTPDDLSTGQPCQASSETHGTTCALALNGDTRRDHPFQLHTAQGDQWVRVLLKASTTNPKVTFYARNCCSSNTGPTMRMFIGAPTTSARPPTADRKSVV